MWRVPISFLLFSGAHLNLHIVLVVFYPSKLDFFKYFFLLPKIVAQKCTIPTESYLEVFLNEDAGLFSNLLSTLLQSEM